MGDGRTGGGRTGYKIKKRKTLYIYMGKKDIEGLVDGTLNAEKKLLMGLWCLGLRGWG